MSPVIMSFTRTRHVNVEWQNLQKRMHRLYKKLDRRAKEGNLALHLLDLQWGNGIAETDRACHALLKAVEDIFARKGVSLSCVWIRDRQTLQTGMYTYWHLLIATPSGAFPVCAYLDKKKRVVREGNAIKAAELFALWPHGTLWCEPARAKKAVSLLKNYLEKNVFGRIKYWQAKKIYCCGSSGLYK